MSRIENAIRRAREKHEKARAADQLQGGTRSIRSGDYECEYPVTVYDLQPSHHCELDQKVLERNRIIHDNYPIDVLTPYKMLRTRVLQQMNRDNWHILAVTAAHEGAGKTLTATNLAIAIASHGDHDVYLLDLDLRKPGIANCLGLPGNRDGLGAFFDGRAPLGQVLWDVGVEHLLVVPGKECFPNSSELITSPHTRNMISTIKTAPGNPIAIIDLPPVLSADDALAVAPMVDAILFVISERETKRADMMYAMELFKDSNIVGVVLNKSKNRLPGY